ncbi:hypothetical protein FNV43_RR25523 [Rhamnella rubrinervis]|uniref:Uncharacterized protein n=1 Tax=Rhamnella rubrinervis TaxID=2594499 RepID=A0A8K0DNR0_9ROSA|nr:hypothetical protein FNV43_RR25523 [Rhamnella rubrinervis]
MILGLTYPGNRIWNKTVAELGYFDEIRIESYYQDLPYIPVEVSSLKYEYTKIEMTKKLYMRKNPGKNKGAIYPYPYSHDMRFDISMVSARSPIAWGYFTRLSVHSQLYNQFYYLPPDYNSTLANINSNKYQLSIGIALYSDVKLGNGVSISAMFSRSGLKVDIFAEGGFTYHVCDLEEKQVRLFSAHNFLNKLPGESYLDALKSYAGLVLDGFLLPQIVLSIFRNSRENALSCSF